MIAIVLIGIMVDRAALTLRNLAIAALFVMVLAPESVVHPSFQMSFAATFRSLRDQRLKSNLPGCGCAMVTAGRG